MTAFEASAAAAPPSAAALSRLQMLLAERCGIVLLAHQQKTLPLLLQQCAAALGHATTEATVEVLARTAPDNPAWAFLLARLTVGESFFFRDQAQMTLLRSVLLPGLIARKRQAAQAGGEKCLRIWSAGCAGGQEIHTVALLLRPLLPDIDDWQLHLLGTDINPEVLATAREGRFREWSFRSTPPEILQACFSPPDSKGQRQLLAPWRQPVRFLPLNLAEARYPSPENGTEALDLILCRNVFIYLSPEVIAQVMQRFAACLVPEGALLLGASDPLLFTPDTFALQAEGPSTYLRRVATGTPRAEPFSPVATTPPRPPTQPPLGDAAVQAALQALGLGVKAPAQAAPAHPQPRSPGTPRPLAVPAPASPELPGATSPKHTATGPEAHALRQEARQLADLGRLDDAQRLCQTLLAADPTDVEAQVLLGWVQTERGALPEAEAAFRKALFLDSAALEVHAHLGRLLLRMGKREPGIKALKNALALAQRAAPGPASTALMATLQQELAMAVQGTAV